MRRQVIRTILSGIYLPLFIGIAFGQSIPKGVIGAAGSNYSNGSHTLEWTLGELSVSQLVNNDLLLDEGFHAGIKNAELSTNIYNLDNVKSFDVFPNPTSGIIKIPRNVRMSDERKIQIYSSQGALMATMTGTDQNQVDLSSLAKGLYYLLIIHADKTGSITKIVRM